MAGKGHRGVRSCLVANGDNFVMWGPHGAQAIREKTVEVQLLITRSVFPEEQQLGTEV